MTFKTKFREIRENQLHLVWIVLAIFEIGVFVACYDRFVLRNGHLPGFLSWARPALPEFFLQDIHRMLWGSYIDAGGIRIGEGISAFAGRLGERDPMHGHTLVIVTMVLSYVIGPSLFLWGMNARKKWMIDKPQNLTTLPILCATALGGYIVIFALMMPLPMAFESFITWQHMKADNYTNAVHDGTSSSLSVLGFQAEQLRLKPETKGGGPWRSGPDGISIADIDTVLPRLERGLWKPDVRDSVKYILEVDGPDSLTIWGVASVEGNRIGRDFKNRDGRTGRVQVRVGVTPERVSMGIDN